MPIQQALDPNSILLQLQAIRQQFELEEQQQQEAAARAALTVQLQAEMMDANPSLARPFPGAPSPPSQRGMAGQVTPGGGQGSAGGLQLQGPPTGPRFNAQTGLTDYLPPHPSMPTMSLPPPSAPAPSTLDPRWGKTKQPFGRTARAELSQERTDELEERQLRVAARGMGKSALGLTSERKAMAGKPVGLAGLMEMFGAGAGPTAIQLDPQWQRAQLGTAIGAAAAKNQGPVDLAGLFGAANRMMDPDAAAIAEPLELVKQAYTAADGDPIEFERQLKLAGLVPTEIDDWGEKLFGKEWATRHQGFLGGIRDLLGGPAVTRRQLSPDEPWMNISKFPVTNERKALGR
ncbi:hypothetical protein LCGC14_2052540 [marine sediment metagenome]|uniref:Uncharacterized protein n=1 Tax=marine sediment metagenome TaxID=412755 RepID=A0A0F9ENP3_9ZZZZ